MAKNKTQFQKGFSLPSFLSQYGTDDQCRKALFQLRWPDGFKCPKCGNRGFCELKSRKLFQCYNCHAQTSVTAGTIFDATKLPLSVWFLGIYFITQSKVGYSALSLSRTLGVSPNTALLMKHKIQQVMKEFDDVKQLTSFIQLDDAYWGGKRRDGIRGRGATGKTPFIAAVSANLKGHPISMRFTPIPSFSRHEIKKWALSHLAPNCKITTDGLNCFPILSEIGFAHKRIITGGGPDSVKNPNFKWVNTVIGNVKKALHGTFHALRKRHLARYLAEFCYRFNYRHDLKAMFPQLIQDASGTPPMPLRLLSVAEFPW
jgi:transposase-like protein